MPHDDLRIPELDELRAPDRGQVERRRARERILTGGERWLARRRRPRSPWDVLAGWSRPGLAAAAIALALVLAALRLAPVAAPRPAEPVALADAIDASTVDLVPALLVALNEPDADAVVEAALLERGGNVSPLDENNPNGGENR